MLPDKRRQSTLRHRAHWSSSGNVAVARAAHLQPSIRDAEALWRSKVAFVDGNAWGELVPDSEGPDSYYIHVAGLRVESSAEVYDALLPGGPYRVFYLRTRKRAVGGQVLPGWRAMPRPADKKRFQLPISIDLG